jgi:hypothetical protein
VAKALTSNGIATEHEAVFLKRLFAADYADERGFTSEEMAEILVGSMLNLPAAALKFEPAKESTHRELLRVVT